MMRPFHLTLHGAPPAFEFDVSMTAGGRTFRPLFLDEASRRIPLPISFEEAAERLQGLPRMFVEMDGSFVWTADSAAAQRWQVDGVMFDRHNRLQFVELKGSCPTEQFDLLLASCGGNARSVIFQIVPLAVFVDHGELLHYLAP